MEIVLSLLDGLLDSVYAIGASLVLKNWHIQYKKETMKKLRLIFIFLFKPQNIGV